MFVFVRHLRIHYTWSPAVHTRVAPTSSDVYTWVCDCAPATGGTSRDPRCELRSASPSADSAARDVHTSSIPNDRDDHDAWLALHEGFYIPLSRTSRQSSHHLSSIQRCARNERDGGASTPSIAGCRTITISRDRTDQNTTPCADSRDIWWSP